MSGFNSPFGHHYFNKNHSFFNGWQGFWNSDVDDLFDPFNRGSDQPNVHSFQSHGLLKWAFGSPSGSEHYGSTPTVGYDAASDKLVINKSGNYACQTQSRGDCYLYSFKNKSWTYAPKSITLNKDYTYNNQYRRETYWVHQPYSLLKTNFVTNRDGHLVVSASRPCGYTSDTWNAASPVGQNWATCPDGPSNWSEPVNGQLIPNLLMWADDYWVNNNMPKHFDMNLKAVYYRSPIIDFDSPGVRKKIYKVYITYRGGHNLCAGFYVNGQKTEDIDIQTVDIGTRGLATDTDRYDFIADTGFDDKFDDAQSCLVWQCPDQSLYNEIEDDTSLYSEVTGTTATNSTQDLNYIIKDHNAPDAIFLEDRFQTSDWDNLSLDGPSGVDDWPASRNKTHRVNKVSTKGKIRARKGGGDWHTVALKPKNSSVANNVYSMQLELYPLDERIGSGFEYNDAQTEGVASVLRSYPVSADTEISDITIVYRKKSVK